MFTVSIIFKCAVQGSQVHLFCCATITTMHTQRFFILTNKLYHSTVTPRLLCHHPSFYFYEFDTLGTSCK